MPRRPSDDQPLGGTDPDAPDLIGLGYGRGALVGGPSLDARQRRQAEARSDGVRRNRLIEDVDDRPERPTPICVRDPPAAGRSIGVRAGALRDGRGDD